MLWHSLVVLFLLYLYQLPDPTPSTIFLAPDFLPKSLRKFTRERHPSLRTSPIQAILVERGVRDVRHPIHIHGIFMHAPRYCEEPWIARQAKSPPSTPLQAVLCRFLDMDFGEFFFHAPG